MRVNRGDDIVPKYQLSAPIHLPLEEGLFTCLSHRGWSKRGDR